MQCIQLNYHLLFFGQLQDGDIQDGGIQTTDILLDSPLDSHIESIVLVVGGFLSLRMCNYKRLVH